MRDDRDYALLPARLRPSGDFRADASRPDVLTTYAGLLFRHLIDHFQGDLTLALGAYNGGSGDPQPAYSASVGAAAASARRTVEESTALSGWQVIPVEIIPYSPPAQTDFRPTFADVVTGDANEVIDEIADRVQTYRSARRKTREVAESEPATADHPGIDSGTELRGNISGARGIRNRVYTAAEPASARNSQ
jgi:hypothetical protein